MQQFSLTHYWNNFKKENAEIAKKNEALFLARFILGLHDIAEEMGFVCIPAPLHNLFKWQKRKLPKNMVIMFKDSLYSAPHYNEVMDRVNYDVEIAIFQTPSSGLLFLVVEDRFYPMKCMTNQGRKNGGQNQVQTKTENQN